MHLRHFPSSRLTIAIAVGLLSLGISIWQLSVPEFLSFYDSGVYIAASMHLVSGVLPYRDFTFVQPPGILLLLSPVAIAGRIFGSHFALELGRSLTGLVVALNCSLLARLVRHRGRAAMVMAGAGLALIPVALYESSAIKLEPYCVCLILLGALVTLRRESSDPLCNRSLFIGGALFGLAAIVKLWAFFPFVAIVICLTPQYRRRVLVFICAAAASFSLVALPFIVTAPHHFISEVFFEQLGRKANYTNNGGALWRLVDMTGFSVTSLAPTEREALSAFIVLAIVVIGVFWKRRSNESADIFLLCAAVATFYMLLAGPDAYTYYAYFTAPFLIGIAAVSISRLGFSARHTFERLNLSRQVRSLVARTSALSAVLLIFGLTLYVTTFYTHYAWFYGFYGPYFKTIDRVIPAGSCVVYDQVSYGVYADRLDSSKRNCPTVVDPDGMWMAWGYQLVPPTSTFSAVWKGYFETAQYAVFSTPHPSGIPWDASLTRWFDHHYHLITRKYYVVIYAKDAYGHVAGT